METFMKGFWVLFFLAVAVVMLRGDNLVNGTTTQTQGNSNSSSVHVKFLPGKDNVEVSNRTSTEVVLNNNKNRGPYYRGGGGGGSFGWGWGGGGGGWYKWGCGGTKPGKGKGRGGIRRSINQAHRKRIFNKEDYKLGESAQYMVRGRCRGMRLDCLFTVVDLASMTANICANLTADAHDSLNLINLISQPFSVFPLSS